MVWLPALFDFDAKNGWQDSRVGRRLSRLRGVERQRRRHRDGRRRDIDIGVDDDIGADIYRDRENKR